VLTNRLTVVKKRRGLDGYRRHPALSLGLRIRVHLIDRRHALIVTRPDTGLINGHDRSEWTCRGRPESASR
jgi:hypothetical protein